MIVGVIAATLLVYWSALIIDNNEDPNVPSDRIGILKYQMESVNEQHKKNTRRPGH